MLIVISRVDTDHLKPQHIYFAIYPSLIVLRKSEGISLRVELWLIFFGHQIYQEWIYAGRVRVLFNSKADENNTDDKTNFIKLTKESIHTYFMTYVCEHNNVATYKNYYLQATL